MPRQKIADSVQEAEWEVLPPEQKQKRAQLESVFRWVAVFMDDLLRLPGTRFRFGLNPLIDFIPAVGDVSAAFVSTSVLLYALRHGLPKTLIARMGLNILLNETIGIIPIAGSAFAFWFRCNHRNYELLRAHTQAPRARRRSDALFVALFLAIILGVIAVGCFLSIFILHQLFRFMVGH